MKKNHFRRLGAVFATGLTLALVTPMQQATAEIREHSFRFASVQVAEHPFSRGAQRFAEIIAEKSGGSRVYGLFFLIFILMEIGWRIMFEFLMAFLQMREALMILSGI